MDYTKNFQLVLKEMSTTKLRKIINNYAELKKLPQWNYKRKDKTPFYYSEFDCKHRYRTICRFYDAKHEINISLRKKAGYYFLIELDRIRIFECDPNVLDNNKEKVLYVLDEYKDLFDDIFNNL